MENPSEHYEISRRKQTFCGRSDEARFKIILVGDSSVGKTSIFLAFTDEDSGKKNNTSVTMVDFRLQPLQIEGQIIKLHIWDTAGQEKYRSIVESYFRGCQGAIIVFDLSKKQSFTHAKNQWFKLCEKWVSPSEIILIGNKADLEHAVNQQQVKEWSSKNEVTYFLTSVTDSRNIEEPFVSLSKKMLQKKKEQIKAQLLAQLKSNPQNSIVSKQSQNINLNTKQKKTNKKGCC